MKKKTVKTKPRLCWAIVMSNGVIDDVGLKRSDFSSLLIGEKVIRVLVSPAPPKKARKTA